MITLSLIERGLAMEPFDSLGAQVRLTPSHRTLHRPVDTSGEPRLSAVLLLTYCRNSQWHIVLTRRREDLASHPGQISFPGGSHENGEQLQDTALREAHEEIGAHPADILLLGKLATLYIPPSDFIVHPFVARHKGPLQLRPDPNEVAEVLEVPIRLLLDPAILQREMWELRGMQIEVPFYRIGPHKVWGATAMILSEFLERLRAAIATGPDPNHE